jgi:putative transposase
MRNRISRSGRCHIRIGEGNARTILLPTIGVVRVHDDTRRLRRLLRPVDHHRPLTGSPALAPRARLLFATVARHGNRWLISLNVEAPDFHAERRHHPPSAGWGKGFVGIDRGIAAFAVAATADGLEVARFHALGRSLADSAGYNAVRKPSRVPSAVPAIALKPLAGLYGNTRALPTSAKIPYIGFRASWPRPTAS